MKVGLDKRFTSQEEGFGTPWRLTDLCVAERSISAT